MRSNRSRDTVNGILLVDKPVGQSSNRTLQEVKNIFNAKKAGHTGSLDVLASGLLPVCLGEATKIAQFLLDSDKVYEAEFTLGKTTSTGDCEGEETGAAGTNGLDARAVNEAITKLTGDVLQVPPMYSALKVNGERLYRLARKGLVVKRENRPVKIYRFEMLDIDLPKISVRVHCSKGTYIRVLAEDLGKLLNCGAFMSKLTRVSSASFHLADAYNPSALEQIRISDGSSALKSLLVNVDAALMHLPEVTLSSSDTRSVKFGQSVALSEFFQVTEIIRLYDESGDFFGIGEIKEVGRMRPKRLFNL